MYVLAAFMSAGLDGKSVVCVNFLPGITLRIETRWRVEDGLSQLVDEWHQFQAILSDWVDGSSWTCTALHGYSIFGLSRSDSYSRNPPPAVEIVRKFAWGELQERQPLRPGSQNTK